MELASGNPVAVVGKRNASRSGWWNAEQIQSVSNDLAPAAKKFGEIADEMRAKAFPELTLQADAAFGIFRSTLVKLAGDVETEFRDQYRCSKTGETPRWKINQKMIAAR